MARLASILIPASEAPISIAALGAATAASATSIGSNRMFAINADQDITILFGLSTVAAPTATSYRIPANQQTVFDMGSANTHIRVFNNSGTTAANIFIQLLSVQ